MDQSDYFAKQIASTFNIFKRKSMVYLFHRKEGFYPLELSSDKEAVANAVCNPGTLKVTDTKDRIVFPEPAAPKEKQ